ncbi:hypothetical protein PENTCL1PPCAC_1557, partial [Pristionchus entomophagus]
QMSSAKLPAELWHHILSFCDHPSECALSRVSRRLSGIVSDKNAFALGKCWRNGITLPCYLLALSSDNADLPLDVTLLMAHNPFGGWFSPHPSTVRGFEMAENEGGKQTFSSQWKTGDEMERGTIEFAVEYESIGIPRWIIDGIRPMIAVSAVLQRSDGSSKGPRVAATMGVWRLDGLSQLGVFTSQESIRMGVCSVANGQGESRFEVVLDSEGSVHGHPALGGSDGLIITFSTRNDVRISDVQLRFDLPDGIPAQFFDCLAESRALRKSRVITGAKNCFDMELLGLYP